jgi:hypothetical protein
MTPIQPSSLSPTKRTDETTGPSQLAQVLTAGLFGPEPLLKVQQRLRIVFAHAGILPVGVVVAKEIALSNEIAFS